jgi:hypothetical protein
MIYLGEHGGFECPKEAKFVEHAYDPLSREITLTLRCTIDSPVSEIDLEYAKEEFWKGGPDGWMCGSFDINGVFKTVPAFNGIDDDRFCIRLYGFIKSIAFPPLPPLKRTLKDGKAHQKNTKKKKVSNIP